MKSTSPRWRTLAPSRFDWEREALDVLRDGLPDYEPYRAWANGEFLAADGSLNEVDLVILAPRGIFLVEIKSRPGRLAGDAATWRWLHDGKELVLDNPLLLANLKSKRLKERLRATRVLSGDDPRLFIQPIVFASAKGLTVQLSAEGRQHIYGRDDQAKNPGALRGIVGFLNEAAAPPRRPLDAAFARAFTSAMEKAGLRPSQRLRRVGEWTLDAPLWETRLHQDWRATRPSMKGHFRRVRIYSATSTGVSRKSVERAARREFDLLKEVDHPGILKAVDYVDHELGPTLLYEHDDRMQRLDHYLAQRGERCNLDFRLHILRSVGEALRHAHGRRLFHRALSPQSLLVLDAGARAPAVKILNWQTGVKEAATTSSGVTGTEHLADVLEDGAAAFLAPESLTHPDANGERLDVFSLGTLAYYLFAGEAPAPTRADLVQRLAAESGGLVLSSIANGVTVSLQELVRKATHPEVERRTGSAKEFLDDLDAVEEELTRPADDAIPSPDEAKVGDRLRNGFVVKRRLGTGSSAVVFDVEREGARYALKLALSPEKNARLSREADALRSLNYSCVIHLVQVEELYGRVGLLLAETLQETLAERLRHDKGRLTLDQLRSWGDDLLKAVVYLEDRGVPHRDIKPENLGLTDGDKGGKRLVLFDFSLSSAPAEAIDAGTRRYIDPFLPLRKPRRWDLAAERWSAAVTLYEMATGTEPRWGDGKSAPAVQKAEARLELELLESAVRDTLGAFFAKAFRREPKERYDNAQEMLWAWRQAFEKAVRPSVSDHAQENERTRLLAAAKPATQLSEVGLSPLALSALDRGGVDTVRDLLGRPKGRYLHMRGAGASVRREIADIWEALRARFPELRAGTPTSTHLTEPEVEAEPSATLATLAAALLPKRWGKASTTEKDALPLLLGLAPGPWSDQWPSQTEVARHVGVSIPQVNRILAKHRGKWLKSPAVTAVRLDVGTILEAHGRVMTARELESALLALRSEATREETRAAARAVLRAAAEAEHSRDEPAWETFRLDRRLLIAADETLAHWAVALGRKADELASRDVLLSPERVHEELALVRRPPLADSVPAARLARLSAAASQSAALSSRLEIYPRGLDALRALKLAAGVIPAAGQVTPEELRARVTSRYPEAAPLPDRPELDTLLKQADIPLPWDAVSNTFVVPSVTVEGVRSSATEPTTAEPRASATSTRATRTAIAPMDDADAFDERLSRHLDDGGWLVLTALPRNVGAAEATLRTRFPQLQLVDLDALVVGALRATAADPDVEADWDVVLAADVAPEGSVDAANLRTLVDLALPRLTHALDAVGPRLLLTNPGLLFRYQRDGILNALRDRAGRAGEALRSAWLLAPLEEPSLGPSVDGVPIPIVTPAQWARIPASWLRRVASDAA